jgi:serine protease
LTTVTRRRIAASIAAVALSAATPSVLAQGHVFNEALLDRSDAYDGFILRFATGARERRSQTAVQARLEEALLSLRSSREIAGTGALTLSHRRRLAVGADVVATSLKLSPTEARATMRRLAALPGVEYVEPNVMHSAALVPNDPRYWNQYGVQAAGTRADRAWDHATGAGVVVGVLDTGITNHADLSANILPGWDFLSNPANARDGGGRDSNPADPGNWSATACPGAAGPANSTWHGTHVTGTIVATGNNGVGVIGTAFGARAIPVRVLGQCGGPVSDIADGIVWASGGSVDGVPRLAAQSTASVLNLSLVSESLCGHTLQAAIDFARSRGVTVVVAAGNKNRNVSTSAPANCAGVIAVASVNVLGNRASDSNFGAGIALSAPGVDILSTSNNGATTPTTEDYLLMSGTSMAAPHVTGAVALVQSRRMALSMAPMFPDDIKVLLQRTADRPVGNCPGGCGAGLVNAEAAVLSAASAAPRLFAAGALTMPAGTVLDAVSIKVAFQTDGNLVVYRQDWAPLWSSGTWGRLCSASTCFAVFQSDGNLVLYQNNVPYWATHTQVPGGKLMFSSVEPHVVIYGPDETLRYTASAQFGALAGTFTLRPAMSTRFAGGFIAYQMDGNLTIYDDAGDQLWGTNLESMPCTASTCVAAFQADGNLVLYASGVPYFATNTVGSRLLVIQAAYPHLRIFDNSNQVSYPQWSPDCCW